MTLPGLTFAHFVLHRIGLQRARTQVSPGERETLLRFAAGARSIVEIGVYEGVTAAGLRSVMSPEGSLTLIDPFPAGRIGISFGLGITRREVDSVRRGAVRFLPMLSFDAIATWNQSIDFLFIDADHQYASVRRDWDEWTPWVVAGGLVALHDSRVHPGGSANAGTGPVRLAAELDANGKGFQRVAERDSLTIWRRGP